MAVDPQPPAVLLGGVGSTLSVARSLGRAGISVHVLAARRGSIAEHSRYVSAVFAAGPGESPIEAWRSWLETSGPQGAVLLPTGDEGVELVVRHSRRLEDLGYRLLDYAGETSLAMLDKSATYELARAAGVSCPRTWSVADTTQLASLSPEVPFPCALKPVHSHLFAKQFSVKVLIAHEPAELEAHLVKTLALGLEMLITEIIPGPDHLNWAFRTYLGEHGEPLFGVTTNRLRSEPVHFGTNCFLVTRWNPEVAEFGLHFLQKVGLRGLAYTEVKKDPRDGQLKLIECNHRFGNAQEVVRRAGVDAALLAYRRALRRPAVDAEQWREGVRLWFPARDFRAARTYRRVGELRWGRWLASLAHPRLYLPYASVTDPMPSIVNLLRKVRDLISTR